MNISFYSFYYEGRNIPQSFIPEDFINAIPIGKLVDSIPQYVLNSVN